MSSVRAGRAEMGLFSITFLYSLFSIQRGVSKKNRKLALLALPPCDHHQRTGENGERNRSVTGSVTLGVTENVTGVTGSVTESVTVSVTVGVTVLLFVAHDH